jgi:predicted nucleic acid-binding protein
VTVIDTSGVVDLLIDGPASQSVAVLLAREREFAAPDILVFETLSAIRRGVRRGTLSESRAAAAIEDLAALPVRLFSSMPLRERVWQLRENLTPADGLFVALAERLGEPLATKDAALLQALVRLPAVDVSALALS